MTATPVNSRLLFRSELKENVLLLRKTAQAINDFKFSQSVDEKITDEEFIKLSVEESKIRALADDLIMKIFQSIVTDIKTPGNKIQQTMDNINDALGELEEVNKILAIAGKVVNLFTTVTLAISTGNIAQIDSIVKQIEGLLA